MRDSSKRECAVTDLVLKSEHLSKGSDFLRILNASHQISIHGQSFSSGPIGDVDEGVEIPFNPQPNLLFFLENEERVHTWIIPTSETNPAAPEAKGEYYYSYFQVESWLKTINNLLTNDAGNILSHLLPEQSASTVKSLNLLERFNEDIFPNSTSSPQFDLGHVYRFLEEEVTVIGNRFDLLSLLNSHTTKIVQEIAYDLKSRPLVESVSIRLTQDEEEGWDAIEVLACLRECSEEDWDRFDTEVIDELAFVAARAHDPIVIVSVV